MFKFMFGALVGASVALLMAPKPGDQLREDLREHANDAMDRGKEMARNVSQRARDLSAQAQEQVG
jgi:gas vesicle protein